MASTADVATLRHSEEMRIRYKIKVGWGEDGVYYCDPFITATKSSFKGVVHMHSKLFKKRISKHIVYITSCNFRDFL